MSVDNTQTSELVVAEPPKTDALTQYSPRSITSNGTVITVANPSAYATDADGNTSVAVYVSK